MTPVPPKYAIESLMRRRIQDNEFSLHDSPTQKWSFRTANLSNGAAVVSALGALFVFPEVLLAIAHLLLLVAQFSLLVYVIACIAPKLSWFRNLERATSAPIVAEFDNYMDLINDLAQNCRTHHLDFAKAHFNLKAKHIRERLGVLIGAFTQIGLIPIAVTAYFGLIKYQKEGVQPFGGSEWLLVAFALIYLFGARAIALAQWMEQNAEIYTQALALKSRLTPNSVHTSV
jgi:hypothetical protein